jgi:hypothetical protein
VVVVAVARGALADGGETGAAEVAVAGLGREGGAVGAAQPATAAAPMSTAPTVAVMRANLGRRSTLHTVWGIRILRP